MNILAEFLESFPDDDIDPGLDLIPANNSQSNQELVTRRPASPGLLTFMSDYMDVLNAKIRRTEQTYQAVDVSLHAVFGDQLARWSECMFHELLHGKVVVQTSLD